MPSRIDHKSNKNYTNTPAGDVVSDLIAEELEYGPWTDPMPFKPSKPSKSQKKTGAMRWLAPDWSIVRWVKNWISDEDEED